MFPELPSLDYYAIEELLTDDERAARDRARRFVEEEVLHEIVPYHRAVKLPEQLTARMGTLRIVTPGVVGRPLYPPIAFNHRFANYTAARL